MKKIAVIFILSFAIVFTIILLPQTYWGASAAFFEQPFSLLYMGAVFGIVFGVDAGMRHLHAKEKIKSPKISADWILWP